MQGKDFRLSSSSQQHHYKSFTVLYPQGSEILTPPPRKAAYQLDSHPSSSAIIENQISALFTPTFPPVLHVVEQLSRDYFLNDSSDLPENPLP